MHHPLCLAAALAACFLFTPASRAESPPSPLRLVPADADLVFTVPDPCKLAETATGLELLRKLEPLSAYQEVVGSTGFRRFRQLVAYYEKAMGAPWPRLLDEVAGGGIAGGVRVGKLPAPSLVVVQGRDEKRVQEFARLALGLLEQEVARQDERVQVTKTKVGGTEVVSLGGKLFAAVAGPAILMANDEKFITEAIHLRHGDGGRSHAEKSASTARVPQRPRSLLAALEGLVPQPTAADASGLLPADALATAWFNLRKARMNPEAAALLRTAPRDNAALTIVFGGYLDLLGRSPFVAAALVREGDDFLVSVRMPKGRNGMGPDSLLHVPPSGGPGRWPLLEPDGVVFSTCFYLDVARIWQDRDKIFPEKVAKSFDKADKETNPFLAGLRISKILPQVGAYHRFVVAKPAGSAYRSSGRNQPQPAIALVSELREPEKFGKAMDATLRTGALLAGVKVKLKAVDEKVNGVTLVGYRFADEQPPIGEDNEFPFRAYSPCFARVGDRFLWCSNLELGRELIGILQAEKRDAEPGAVTSRLYPAGGAAFLQIVQDQLVTQEVLERAVPAERAEDEVKTVLGMLRTIGPVNFQARYEDDRFCYEIRLKNVK